MRYAFNTDMFSLPLPTMRSRRLASCLPQPAPTHADADANANADANADADACNDAGAPEPAQHPGQAGERRGRRRRFAIVAPAQEEHEQTGSIAVSFAIVSRSRWPR
jgi:hypothetical protein